MEVDVEDECESEYRIEAAGLVKYITIAPGTIDPDLLSLPLTSLPPLPYMETSWTAAHISRDMQTGELKSKLSNEKLPGVENVWHSASFNVLSLQRTKQLTAAAFEALIPEEVRAVYSNLPTSGEQSSGSGSPTVIAKIARFAWEIPRIEQETRTYELLHSKKATDLAPRFLGHLHERGRVMGFLLEKVQGHDSASINDLRECELTLKRFHALGLLHGDVNRYNFLVGNRSVKLIDFERSQEGAAEDVKAAELRSLRAQLTEETGRGGGLRPSSDDE